MVRSKIICLKTLITFILIIIIISSLQFYFRFPKQVCGKTSLEDPNVYIDAQIDYVDLIPEAKEVILQVYRGNFSKSLNAHTLVNDGVDKMLLPINPDSLYYLNTYVLVKGDKDTYGPGDEFGKKRMIFGKGGDVYYTFDHHKCFSKVILGDIMVIV